MQNVRQPNRGYVLVGLAAQDLRNHVAVLSIHGNDALRKAESHFQPSFR
jgi:hypothetical protein